MRKLLLVVFIGIVLALCTYGIVEEINDVPSTITVYVE